MNRLVPFEWKNILFVFESNLVITHLYICLVQPRLFLLNVSIEKNSSNHTDMK